MTGWILLTAFLLLLVYLLTAPVWLEIDSGKGRLTVRFHRLLIVTFFFAGEKTQGEIRFLGMQRKLSARSPGKTNEQAQTRRAKRKPLPLKKIIAVLRSFRVKELVLHLDTGDQPTNGLLYPVAAWLRHRTGHDIRIGFAGEHTLVLRIRNNLARMLWAYMRAK